MFLTLLSRQQKAKEQGRDHAPSVLLAGAAVVLLFALVGLPVAVSQLQAVVLFASVLGLLCVALELYSARGSTTNAKTTSPSPSISSAHKATPAAAAHAAAPSAEIPARHAAQKHTITAHGLSVLTIPVILAPALADRYRDDPAWAALVDVDSDTGARPNPFADLIAAQAKYGGIPVPVSLERATACIQLSAEYFNIAPARGQDARVVKEFMAGVLAASASA